MKKIKFSIRKIILIGCCAMMFTGTLHAAVPTEKSNSVADNDLPDEIRESDEAVIENYILSINGNHYEEIASCFCDSEAKDAFFSNELNQENHVGVYNVLHVNDYGLTELEVSENYLEYENVRIYLLWLNCDVVTSNQFYMQGDNYFQVVMATENNKRGFVEFSVVPESVVYDAIGCADFSLTEDDFQSYIYNRVEMFESLDGYEVIKTDEVSSNPMARRNYNPTSLTSYVFPSYITVYISSSGENRSYSFQLYCYLVSARELGCGTDSNGPSDVHMEALKAFSLCVRNVGWYRTIYPYDSNAGYHVHDVNDQHFDYSLRPELSIYYQDNVDAMDAVWNVMMFDGAKKLFFTDYRAGSYNANKTSGDSRLYQNGANYLATVLGYDYKEILHYYYDDAVGTKISSGPIIVCSSHTRATSYTTTALGHGKVCTTCGHIIYSGHSWVTYSTYMRCSVCNYIKSVSVAE